MSQPITVMVKAGALPDDQVERFLSLAAGRASVLLTNAGIDHGENCVLGIGKDLPAYKGKAASYAVLLPDATPVSLQEQINHDVQSLWDLALDGKLPHANFSGK